MMNKKIYFVTTNKHKVQEVKEILKGYALEIEQLNEEYAENHDESLEKIVENAVKELARKLEKPVVIEDTGLFFEAYAGFPGALPKFVFNSLGFQGIFKLLQGENRKAYFKTVVGFCEPGQEPVLFSAKMEGEITEEVFDKDKDLMPYDHIFQPEGKTKTISGMSLKEKNEFSQRAKAFRKFGDYMRENILERLG